jgi:hypothetical protein
MLTQAAFELLAWTRLVEETHAVTKKTWGDKSMSFSKKFGRLLESCSIPQSVPAGLDRMLAFLQDLPEIRCP